MISTKPPILFLCHRIPFPPDKGDKIRSYNLLVFLSRHFTVHLGTFIDDPQDRQYIGDVQNLCTSCHFVFLNNRLAKFLSLRAFLGRQPLTNFVYRNKSLQNWVNRLLRTDPLMPAIMFSSSVSQFLIDADCGSGKRFVDFVDVDSDKWRQYAAKLDWPKRWFYGRESQALEIFEKKVCSWADRSYFVSMSEATLFKQQNPELIHKIDYYNNGVNFTYFSPDHTLANPYNCGKRIIVFTGAMDYWPNIEAVKWFSQSVLPMLLNLDNNWHFYIVGSNPGQVVTSFGKHDSITVTGRVDDVRPYLKHASVSVAPMHTARGIQNKVLEAMAMQLPVLVSAKGIEGINAKSGQHIFVADQPDEYVRVILSLDSEKSEAVGRAARELVIREFDWPVSLNRLAVAIKSAMFTGNF